MAALPQVPLRQVPLRQVPLRQVPLHPGITEATSANPLKQHGMQQMAVYRLLKNEPFEAEEIATMTQAYAEVCRTFGSADRERPEPAKAARSSVGQGRNSEDHSIKDLITKTVIELAQRGARDPILLRDGVLRALQQ